LKYPLNRSGVEVEVVVVPRVPEDPCAGRTWRPIFWRLSLADDVSEALMREAKPITAKTAKKTNLIFGTLL